MNRDGWIALVVMVLTCIGVAVMVVGATHLIGAVIEWIASW